MLDADPQRAAAERRSMNQHTYELDSDRRTVVLETLQDVCRYRGWTLLAAHVRSNHVHIVLEAEERPEKVMTDFKAYASQALNRFESGERGRKRWARHGDRKSVV